MDNYTISWSAPEHEHREHSADWYWAVSIVTISLAIAFVLLDNMLLSIIILLGIGALLVHTKHPSRLAECTISKKGIRIDSKLYPWETLESFWILDGKEDVRYPHGPKILLISKKTFMTHIVIPLSADSLDEVHQTLSHMLHEEPQVEPLPDRLMRRLGF